MLAETANSEYSTSLLDNDLFFALNFLFQLAFTLWHIAI